MSDPAGAQPASGTTVSGMALEVTALRAGYGGIEVLHGIDFTLGRGELMALLGPNGAGKSTTLKVLSGRLPASSGEVAIDGATGRSIAPEKLARRGLCCIPEGRGVFPNLTVSEHLWMWTYRGGVERDRLEHEVFGRFPLLGERRSQLAGSLSGGERQMLSLSRAMCPGVRALLCDELSMGLAPRIVAELFEFLQELCATGVTVLVVEQFAHAVLQIASSAAVLVEGRIRVAGTPSEVEAGLAEIYLGS